ncbi:hypothetical protein SAMN04487996_107100 [Dyadobacter soli]|uniref:Uncharacterized protein n=1 Tax=Dyadobacter soli TaxID=659014 RepID=A0A1G7G2Z9_9BACT|nr:hypothetical protein [Dyadobacter soli]SDE82399.1 hypothetical protein SAMN04487996_107100 [Dyadobacter soli]
METSYKNAFRFVDVAQALLKDESEEDTKFVAALNSVIEQINDQREEYGKKVVKIQRKHAAEDKFGCILRDDRGNYRFKKDQEEAMEAKIDELFNHESGIEFDPEYVDEESLPSDLPKHARKWLVGFVIAPAEVEQTPAEKLLNSLPTTKNRQSNGE